MKNLCRYFPVSARVNLRSPICILQSVIEYLEASVWHHHHQRQRIGSEQASERWTTAVINHDSSDAGRRVIGTCRKTEMRYRKMTATRRPRRRRRRVIRPLKTSHSLWHHEPGEKRDFILTGAGWLDRMLAIGRGIIVMSVCVWLKRLEAGKVWSWSSLNEMQFSA